MSERSTPQQQPDGAQRPPKVGGPDRPTDVGAEGATPASVAPRSARPASAAGPPSPVKRNEAERGESTPAGRRQTDRGGKPRSAREAVGAPPVEPETPRDEVSLTIDGASWIARVMGRSWVGERPGAATLTLVGFVEGNAESSDHTVEAWVVATSLADLTEAELVAAFETASPARDPNRVRSFFGSPRDRRR